MKRLALPSILCTLILSSCLGEKESKFDFNLILETNSPVNFDESLSVAVQETFSDYTYDMIPPNGWSGYDTYYDKDNARFSDKGWYVVHAYGPEGRTVSDSVYVDVIPAQVPCSPSVDQLRSSSLGLDMNFTYVNGRVNFTDFYEVTANSSNGDFYVEFGHEFRPEGDRTYVSQGQTSFLTSDEVSVGMTRGVWWTGGKGQYVHVTEENGKTYVTLCDFEMNSSAGSVTIDARLEF